MSIGALLPASVKRRLKPYFHRGKRKLVETFRAYGAAELAQAVRSLGVATGDCLFVHGGFSAYNGFRGGAGDCVDVLLDVLGPDGHLLMPSMAYGGASEAFARSGTVFDVRATPSAMGMLTEVLRRRDGTQRSASPLHPVLAHGPRALWLTVDHEKLPYSCGPGSPFERFLALDGKVLFIDASFDTLTFMHYVEHRHRDHFPFPLYAEERLPIPVRTPEDREIPVRQHLFSAETRARRTFGGVEALLRERGLLGTRRLGNSTLLSVSARDVVTAGDDVVERGPGLYV